MEGDSKIEVVQEVFKLTLSKINHTFIIYLKKYLIYDLVINETHRIDTKNKVFGDIWALRAKSEVNSTVLHVHGP